MQKCTCSGVALAAAFLVGPWCAANVETAIWLAPGYTPDRLHVQMRVPTSDGLMIFARGLRR